MEDQDNQDRESIYGNTVRAGKRTYFFDVRATKANDYYLTITESKKRFNDDGSHTYQKHKVFLYKEDFQKFSEALSDVFKKIIELNKNKGDEAEEKLINQFTDINFDQLGSTHKKED